MIVETGIVLILVVVFHLTVYPFIKGFYDGYKDAINNKPYNNKINNDK